MVRRRPVDLTDYSSIARTRGDIVVGAFARQQRRRRILIAAGGVILTVAAIWLYFALQPEDARVDTNRFDVLVKCARCGEIQTARVKAGEAVYPLECQHCGERACLKLWECRMCGTRFLPKTGERQPKCPECGSRNVGTARPRPERPTDTPADG
jgi:DNA-directed RNA polymerase subunit RPC12/RpoP